MALVPDNPEIPPSPAVRASNDNTEIILDRIRSGEEGTKERIAVSDRHTDKLVEEQDKKLREHREVLGEKIDVLADEVKETNGKLKTVETKVEAVEGKVEIVEDRADQIAQARSEKLTVKQGITIASAGAFASALLLVILHLSGAV